MNTVDIFFLAWIAMVPIGGVIGAFIGAWTADKYSPVPLEALGGLFLGVLIALIWPITLIVAIAVGSRIVIRDGRKK